MKKVLRIGLFVLLIHGLIGCDSKRIGQPFQATVYDYDSWFVAAVETGTATGKVASYYFSRPYGTLELAASADVGQGPVSVASVFGQRIVYVANNTSGSISVLSVDRSTGGFSLVQTVTGLTGIRAVRTTPAGYLYAGYASGIQRYTIDPATGSLTATGAVTSFGGAVLKMQIAPGQNALYVSVGGNALHEAGINSSTGALTANLSFAHTTIESLSAGTHSSTGNEYLAVVDSGANTISIYRISSTTGFLSLVGTTAVTSPKSVTYLSGYSGVVVQSSNGTIRTYTQNSSGVLSLSSTYSTLTETAVSFMNLSADGGLIISLGTGGASLWDVAPNSAGNITMTFRRRQTFSSIGQYANEFAPVSK